MALVCPVMHFVHNLFLHATYVSIEIEVPNVSISLSKEQADRFTFFHPFTIFMRSRAKNLTTFVVWKLYCRDQ